MARWQVPVGLRLKRTRFSIQEGLEEGEGEDFHSYAATLFGLTKECVYASLFRISKAANVFLGAEEEKPGQARRMRDSNRDKVLP